MSPSSVSTENLLLTNHEVGQTEVLFQDFILLKKKSTKIQAPHNKDKKTRKCHGKEVTNKAPQHRPVHEI